MYKQILAGVIPVYRRSANTRWIFSAFSSDAERESTNNKEVKNDEGKPEEVVKVEKMLAEKESALVEKENEVKDMKVIWTAFIFAICCFQTKD